MTATHCVFAAGVLYAALALFHLGFWRLFRWREELARLGAVNRGVMQVLNLCLTYLFIVAAAGFCFYPAEIMGSDTGRVLLAALAGFWLLRALYQPWFFGLKHWLSIALFVSFAALAVLHAMAWWLGNAARNP
jgi:hypothetical protein